MTTPNPATTQQDPPPPPADDTTTTDPNDDQPPGGDQHGQQTSNNEAARYRVRLRETEAERDNLAERVTGYQRRECEQLVGDVLAQPADLWDIAGADVTEFFDENGTVDENAVQAAAAALIESRPGLAAHPPQSRHREWGQHGGNPPSAAPGWSAVIGR